MREEVMLSLYSADCTIAALKKGGVISVLFGTMRVLRCMMLYMRKS